MQWVLRECGYDEAAGQWLAFLKKEAVAVREEIRLECLELAEDESKQRTDFVCTIITRDAPTYESAPPRLRQVSSLPVDGSIKSNEVTLVHQIGRGSFGDVYFGLCRIQEVDQEVAVKTLKDHDEFAQRMFRTEVHIIR